MTVPSAERTSSGARALLWPGVMTVIMLAILLALGTWQVKRLAWKEGVLARIAAAEAAPPVPLPAHPQPFEKVSVTGSFLPGTAALYGVEVRDTPVGAVMGGQLLAPFRRQDGALMLIDRGWVPDDAVASTPVPAGTVEVTGFVRLPEKPRLLGAADDPAHRRFFTLDPAAIAAALGLPHVAPLTLVALGPGIAGQVPIPAAHLPRPPNNHFSYALTWYGLAAALAVIFVLWARERLFAR